MFVEVEVKTLNPADAKQMFEQTKYERQRVPSRSTIKYYVDQMSAGEFAQGTTIQLAGFPNGDGKLKWRLIDGQHRLLAQSEAGVDMTYVIQRRVVDDESQVGILYGKIDMGRGRNMHDVVRAYQIDLETGLPIDLARKAVTSAAFLKYGFRHPNRYSISPESKIAYAREFSEAADAYNDAIANCVTSAFKKMLFRSSVMSVALATIQEASGVYGDEFVLAFWRKIAADDGLRRGDPCKTAVTHIRESGETRETGKRMVSAAYSARYIASCWNAYAEKRDLQYARVNDASAPVVLKGTRWDGTKF